jgi:hypothetical protein
VYFVIVVSNTPPAEIFRGWRMIPKRGNRLPEKHALGIDPRDHAQPKEL